MKKDAAKDIKIAFFDVDGTLLVLIIDEEH